MLAIFMNIKKVKKIYKNIVFCTIIIINHHLSFILCSTIDSPDSPDYYHEYVPLAFSNIHSFLFMFMSLFVFLVYLLDCEGCSKLLVTLSMKEQSLTI